jgi:ATP-dependent Lhr-like helicase
MPTSGFHAAVAAWFERTFDAPTPAQVDAWPAIQANRDVLIAAPTGSGKTLAAFLAHIDALVREASASGELPDETRVVYVSPLKALSNDVQKNLLVPLNGIDDELFAVGLPPAGIRTWVRTGDTPQGERASMRRRPPHILVTTPESLYILLGSESGRTMLSTARTVIVDEIHALVGNKRGAHLALSLERLDSLAGRPLTRVGLSATQKPLDEVARFLVGAGRLRGSTEPDCTVIDSGHRRARDLALELPPTPLGAVMSGEQWEQVYDRVAQLVHEHRSTLVFVNTRRHVERAARQLSQRLGEEHVAAHHGSLSRERRLAAEQRLKRGELKVLVATASLELGIDIGDVDLACQLGSTRSINTFLQRVGRSGHGVGGLPKGRLFPTTRDELVECSALLDAVRRGELDRLSIPRNALDVLAQQIVAELAWQDWDVTALYELFRRAYPYRDLPRSDFDEAVRMLSEGFSTRRGRRGALIFYDGVNERLRARKGAKLTAVTSGGTIPDSADYQVLLEPEGITVGSLNEDFAVESLAGDVFQLGNTSYRILRVERGTVRVEDAKGQPPSMPFWLGEAPGRTRELSLAVTRLRQEVERRLGNEGEQSATQWLTDTVGVGAPAATQVVGYLASARAALGVLPTHDTIVFERFFDEAGGMQFVVHSPYGSRINRAWGLALRKRFCRQFNFELQAAATEDCIVLSLTTAHSFQLAEVARYLHSNSARDILVQALCAAPMFTTRWRWTASVALALPRFRGGRKVPPQIARMNAEDLLASIFPEQVGCAENQPGDIPIPDHPLVRQALRDCLEEAMDVEGFESLLRALESGAVRVVARDLTEPSPMAQEVLSARPYAYLDDAPLEERRTQAVMSRRWLDPEDAADLGRLDPAAIARVRDEAWPEATTPDELHDALMWLGFLTGDEVAAGEGWAELIRELVMDGRVVEGGTAAAARPTNEEHPADRDARWIAVERVPLWRAIHPERPSAGLDVPPQYDRPWTREEALREIARGRLQGSGPTTAQALAAAAQMPIDDVDAALIALEAEGFALRGVFDTETAEAADARAVTQWCERRLLARIHRYTVKRLRAEIEPVKAREFVRFLFEWQGVSAGARRQGPDAVPAVLNQLAGFDVPAGAWETEVLPTRIVGYEPTWLDEHCVAGRYLWARLAPRAVNVERSAAPVRATPIVLLPRRHARTWSSLVRPADPQNASSIARAVAEFIHTHGAAFFDEIVEGTRLLPTQVESALSELVALGIVNADSFAGLRVLLLPVDRRRRSGGTRRVRGRMALFGMEDAGRWAMVHRGPRAQTEAAGPHSAVEHVANVLLQRWGVVFWKLYQREAQWLPPWRELLMVYRRLEARGEIRGGRFVAGFSGEQYATPAAIGALRENRRRGGEGEWVSISAADPLNVVGLLTPGNRVPALTRNRILYRDGVPMAASTGGLVCFYEELDGPTEWEARNRLLRRPASRKVSDVA